MGGACGKSAEQSKNNKIDKALKKAQGKNEKVLKVLLLGTGESGKSTIFKQARTAYGRGYTESDRKRFKGLVYQNIITQMQAIIKYRKQVNIALENAGNSKLEDIILQQGRVKALHLLPSEVYEALRALWDDQSIKKCWEQKASFQVFDSLEYFLTPEVLDRIENLTDTYIPTFDDCLHVRIKTVGVVSEDLVMNKTSLEMYDVGGQRTERDKWIDCFDNVTTVMFVAAINEYDQTLYEASGVNRIKEALEVWTKIVNRLEFKTVTFVLFLNKWDLFQKKVCETAYRLEGVRNEDYTGKDPREFTDGSKEQTAAIMQCFEHSKQQFLSRIETEGRTRSVDAYPTIAIDKTNMTKIFAACQSSVLEALIANTL